MKRDRYFKGLTVLNILILCAAIAIRIGAPVHAKAQTLSNQERTEGLKTINDFFNDDGNFIRSKCDRPTWNSIQRAAQTSIQEQDLPQSDVSDDIARWKQIRNCVKNVEDLELFDSVLARNDCKNGNVNPLDEFYTTKSIADFAEQASSKYWEHAQETRYRNLVERYNREFQTDPLPKIEGSSNAITGSFDITLACPACPEPRREDATSEWVTVYPLFTRYKNLLETPATPTKQITEAISTRYKIEGSSTRNHEQFRNARRTKKDVFDSWPAPRSKWERICVKTFSTSRFLATNLCAHGPGTSQLSGWLRVRNCRGERPPRRPPLAIEYQIIGADDAH